MSDKTYLYRVKRETKIKDLNLDSSKLTPRQYIDIAADVLVETNQELATGNQLVTFAEPVEGMAAYDGQCRSGGWIYTPHYEPYTPNAPKQSTVGKFTIKGGTDEYGGVLFNLTVAGHVYECVSGQPHHYPVPISQDYPGSNNPIPQGEYKVGPTHYDPKYDNRSDGIGPWWTDLTPLQHLNGRAGFLIHMDYNWQRSPGTAGCISPTRERNYHKIAELVEKGLFTKLVVDYGL